MAEDFTIDRGGFLGVLAECGIVMPSTANIVPFDVRGEFGRKAPPPSVAIGGHSRGGIDLAM